MRFLIVLALALPFSLRAQQTDTTTVYRLILIGDAGLASVRNAPYQDQLNQHLNNAQSKYSIVMLGDNIYPSGMPLPKGKGRSKAEEVIRSQMELLKPAVGDIIYLPGNHDWKQGHKGGLGHVLEQKRFLNSLNDSRIKFIPEGGCPGPVELPLNEDLTLVILDSQWFLHPWDKPQDDQSTCEARSVADVWVQLEDILLRNRDKRVVIAAHHPLITYGEHGGHFTIKDHLFPLTDFKKNLYIPLPVLGSIYPLYRKVFGNIQDVQHPEYKLFSESLQSLMEQYPGTIYAAGHEHTLQHIEKNKVHYVVSGAGAKKSPVKRGKHSRFAASALGFSVVSIRANGSTHIDYYTAEGRIYREVLLAFRELRTTATLPSAAVREVIAAPSTRYEASERHAKWLGANYRKEWSLPLKFPVFDIGKEKGGLKILQTGGGMQTLSLRLADSTGNEYTLRSVEKFPEKAVPEQFKKTFAEDLVQDQISASHPYGAVVVPFLAEAAGIYHTNPKVVYVPDDPRLGIYQSKFANQLMLFEERPSGSGKGMPFFGNADKIISTARLLEKLEADNDNRVDQKFVLRNRLFDLWIGDWDRHDDQWRWAEFDEKKGKTYRPIPRDRDQAFFVSEGIFPSIWSKKWALPKFQGFDDELKWPNGFMYNARYFDRNFLNEVAKEEWVKVAEDLTASMTDEVIEKSIRQWPAEIFELHGEEIIRKLKSRRALLKQYAMDHYEFLAEEVEVVGTEKKEWIEVDRGLASTKVTLYKITKENEKGKQLYFREFFNGETKEVRIFGRGGDDKVVVKGDANKILIRVIGGDGEDVLENTSRSKRGLIAYDLTEGVQQIGKWRDFTSSNPVVNEYNRKSFLYDRLAPLIFANFNIDDGLFLGGGFLYTKHGFRKNPYKEQHLFLGSVALNTASFNFRYDGRFTEVIGKWNLEIDLDVKSPNYVNNFFGWGNETVFDRKIDEQPGLEELDNPIQYYRLRFKEYAADVKLSRKIGSSFFFKIGPSFQRVGIEDPETNDRYIKVYDATLTESILEKPFQYLGGAVTFGLDKRNHPSLTTRGIYLQHTLRNMHAMYSSGSFTANNVSLSLYQSFRFPAKLTFAFRAGGGWNTGDYQLYQAQILDGKTELRGFRKTRFYGDSKLYFNNELRWKLTSFRSYLFPASFGVLAFYDVGRVWYEDENGIDPSTPSGKSIFWHRGIGGGVWFTPFNMTALTTEVAHSDDGWMAYLRLGFLF